LSKKAKRDIFENVESQVEAELAALKIKQSKNREGYNQYIKDHQEEHAAIAKFGSGPDKDQGGPPDLWDISDDEVDQVSSGE
jgi:hypothetical protein